MVKSGYFCPKPVLGYKFGVVPDVSPTHDQWQSCRGPSYLQDHTLDALSFIDGTAVRRFECWSVTVVALFSCSFFSFPWPKTDSIQVRYLVLLMVDGYEETDWPMQYPQSFAIAWAWFERLIRRSLHL